MNYIAHIRESDGQIQTVEEHLLEARDLAESFGETVGVKHIAGLQLCREISGCDRHGN